MMYKENRASIGHAPKTQNDRLVTEGVIGGSETDRNDQAYRAALDRGEHVEQTRLSDYQRSYSIDWTQFKGYPLGASVETAVPLGDLQRLATKKSPPSRPISNCNQAVAKTIGSAQAYGKGKFRSTSAYG